MNTGKPYLIGETAFHHEGDAAFLSSLIKEIGKLKFDAIKFHLLLNPESYMVSDHKAIDQIKKWTFTPQQWSGFIKKAENLKLDVILLCNDVESIDFVCSKHPDVRAIELHATGLNDYFLLEKAANFPGTVILGTGGSSLDEIHYAVDFLKYHGKNDIFLMYGFQSFPTNYKEINLSKILKISQLFDLPVGYADHTDPKDPNVVFVSTAAAAMGIFILEKHFTHVFGKPRTDYQSAVNKQQIIQIRELLKLYHTIRGNGSLDMSESEKAYGNTGPMKKAIVATKKIKKGEKLSLNNLGFKRTNDSSCVRQNQFLQLIGLDAKYEIQKDEIIDFSKVNFNFQKAVFGEFNVSSKKKK